MSPWKKKYNLADTFNHVHYRSELQGVLDDEGSRQAYQVPETYRAPATKSKPRGAAHARDKYVNPDDAHFYADWSWDQYWLESLARNLVFLNFFLLCVDEASVLKPPPQVS